MKLDLDFLGMEEEFQSDLHKEVVTRFSLEFSDDKTSFLRSNLSHR